VGVAAWLERANALSQPRAGYRFGPENLLLPDLLLDAPHSAPQTLIDLGAGCGVLGLLGAMTTGAECWLVERNGEMVEHLQRNRTAVSTPVQIVSDDLRSCDLPAADLIVANPPFFRVGEGMRSKHETVRDATHSHHGELYDFVSVAASRLAPGGHLWLLYPTDRIGQLFDAAAAQDLHLTALYNLHARHTGRSYRVWCRLERQPAPMRMVCMSVLTER
jgi:tRNA1Val (adenine37-N6)-methyltransferase